MTPPLLLPGLTPRRREVLEAIRRLTRAHGMPPTLREIGEAIGAKSSATTHQLVRGLEEAGFVRCDRHKLRCIRIASEPDPIELLQRWLAWSAGERDEITLYDLTIATHQTLGGEL